VGSSLTFDDNTIASIIIRKKVLNKSESKKSLCNEWDARHNVVYALRVRNIDVLKPLTNISSISKNTVG